MNQGRFWTSCPSHWSAGFGRVRRILDIRRIKGCQRWYSGRVGVPLAAQSTSPLSARTRPGLSAVMVLRIPRIARSLTTAAGGLRGWPVLADVVANRTQGPRREADAGLGHDPDEVYTQYADP